jgi:hypothetical protein
MTDVNAPGEGDQVDEGEDRDYPLVREAVEAAERSVWGLVDALLAEARTVEVPTGGSVGADGRQVAHGEMERISRFIERGSWGSSRYSPNYLRQLHQMGRWAAGHAEVRDYSVSSAKVCHSHSVPVMEAVSLMATCRREPLPAGVPSRRERLRRMVSERNAPTSLDAKRDGSEDVPPAVAQYRRFKAAERAATNLGQLVRWAEQANAEQLAVFADEARALHVRLGAVLAELDRQADETEAPAEEAPKAKRTRRAKAATG